MQVRLSNQEAETPVSNVRHDSAIYLSGETDLK